MPKTSKPSKNKLKEKKGIIYVSLYKGEPAISLSQQIRDCLQMEQVRQQTTIEILGDIEDPKVSIEDTSLSYPPYECTLIKIMPHNGKWSGFHLLATREKTDAPE